MQASTAKQITGSSRRSRRVSSRARRGTRAAGRQARTEDVGHLGGRRRVAHRAGSVRRHADVLCGAQQLGVRVAHVLSSQTSLLQGLDDAVAHEAVLDDAGSSRHFARRRPCHRGDASGGLQRASITGVAPRPSCRVRRQPSDARPSRAEVGRRRIAPGRRDPRRPDASSRPRRASSRPRCVNVATSIYRTAIVASMLDLAILGLLGEKDRHGYEIRRLLRDELGLVTNVSFGSLYPALARLERLGAVEVVSDTDVTAPPTPSTGSLVRRARRGPGAAHRARPRAAVAQGLPAHRQGHGPVREAPRRVAAPGRPTQLRAPPRLARHLPPAARARALGAPPRRARAPARRARGRHEHHDARPLRALGRRARRSRGPLRHRPGSTGSSTQSAGARCPAAPVTTEVAP